VPGGGSVFLHKAKRTFPRQYHGLLIEVDVLSSAHPILEHLEVVLVLLEGPGEGEGHEEFDSCFQIHGHAHVDVSLGLGLELHWAVQASPLPLLLPHCRPVQVEYFRLDEPDVTAAASVLTLRRQSLRPGISASALR